MKSRIAHTRYLMMLLSLLSLAISLGSCHRRPLLEADCVVNIHFTFDYDIVNHVQQEDPELMRVVFYDHESGKRTTEAFLPPTGGSMIVPGGRFYDVVAWNFDTDITKVRNDGEIGKVLATTDDIPTSSRTRLKSRSKSSSNEELFLYSPDHLFVGRDPDQYIDPTYVGTITTDITLDCHTVVESWLLNVDKIRGAEHIASLSVVISGLSEYNLIGVGQQSQSVATVYFDNGTLNSEGLYHASFNTFGANPLSSVPQILSIVITDISGKSYVFNTDVSDQFVNNPLQVINIFTDDIDIPIPTGDERGGLDPSVDEWKDFISNIEI